jgi:pre-mRNA-splicing factor 38A
MDEYHQTFGFRYVRALGAYYLRLVGSAIDCYKYLEPLYNDYRKIRIQRRDGSKF